MFKKKPQIKPFAPIRSSDRRKTADQIISNYSLQETVNEVASTEDKAAATNAHTALRNSLLPDNVQSARFTTTHGPDLQKVSGTVYVGSHVGVDQRILWFKIEDVMYPTVYTLWQHPNLVPLLHTPDMVVKKIQGGADLMTPGLAGPPFPEKAKKGATVAIASLDKPSVPVAVGTCAIDVSALGSVQGAKGHAVQTLHWAGDEIWSYSTSGKSGTTPPTEIPGWNEDRSDDGLAKFSANLTLDDEDEGGVSLSSGGETSAEREREAAKEEGTDEPTTEETLAQASVSHMSTKEIDEAFRNAFLYGVYHHMSTKTNDPSFGLQFPLTQSFVMSNLIQPFLPAFTPEQERDLQIKNTSHKNIKKFIKSLDKAMLVKSKERDRHETTILDIDYDDAAIKSFKPYRLPKKETMNGASLGRGDKATDAIDTNDTSVGQKVVIKQFYKAPERLSSLFESETSSTSQHLFTASELRDSVTAYIERENLVSEKNKRLITLNPLLANTVFDGTQPLDREVQAKGSVPRDALVDRIRAACAPQYTVTREGETSSSKPKSGSPPKVKITLETRGGNKTVTKISGVETFLIQPQPLADELRKVCAGATSVEQLQGSSPKNPVMEIMVQGPQKDAVVKALERRGVRSLWVEVLDKTKKKK